MIDVGPFVDACMYHELNKDTACCFFSARRTSFNPSVLDETDSNGDVIKVWCVASGDLKSTEAKCIFCNVVICCAQHGASAIKRHASTKMHLKTTERHRNAERKLMRPKELQPTLSFSGGANILRLDDSVTRAEALFALSLAVRPVPFTYADTASSTFAAMFPDSKIAEKFSCGRTKVSYIISDGLGPYFKKKVTEEASWPDVYYSIQIDETPKPEQHVQQLDVLLRYFSKSQQRVVVEHLESFNLGRATSAIIVDCIETSLVELPKNKLLCFFSDGPNTMKSVKKKLKESVNSNLLDIGECNLHKVHNAFGSGLTAFGSDVEQLVIDIYYFFKYAVRSSHLQEQQKILGIPEHVFLLHVSNRWLSFQDSLERVVEQYTALKAYFHTDVDARPTSSALQKRLATALADKKMLAKMLFLRNTAELFAGFQALFQKQEPLIHIVHSESLCLTKKLLSRFMRHEVYATMTGAELKQLDVGAAEGLKQVPEVGMDTEEEMRNWSPQEKKAFRVAVKAFYVTTTKHLLKQLPLDNKLLQHLRFLDPHPSVTIEETVHSLKYVAARVPQIVRGDQVASLIDEWYSLQCQPPVEDSSSKPIDMYWAGILGCAGQTQKYPLLSVLIRALLSLPHGNADCERGFSENKRVMDNRANLCIAKINGIRQVKTFARRFGSDPSSVPLTRDLINAVKHSHRVYSERLHREAQERDKEKRKSTAAANPAVEKRMKLSEEKECLERSLQSSKAMLQRARELIKTGLATKNMEEIESGHVLLSEANTSLVENMSRLTEVNESLQKL